VLKFLASWLYALFQDDRQTYAGIALGLIITQGFVLEILTGLYCVGSSRAGRLNELSDRRSSN